MRIPLFLIAALLLSSCAAGNVSTKANNASATKANNASATRVPSTEENIKWNTQGGIETAFVGARLAVVRADPLGTPLELVNPPESVGNIAQVARRFGYSVVINAAMFAQDYKTSIGYMRNFDRVNNPQLSAKLRGFLMFHPKSPGLPSVKIGGKDEIAGYDSVFQTHRMWTEADGILWKKGASIYRQVALVGVDDRNRVLFFYHPALVDVHDLVASILELNLGLTGLLYLDGGNHGSLFLAPALGRSWNTWIPLPNVLGIRAAP